MAHIIDDRVKELSSNTGVVPFVLNGATNGCQTFSSAIGNNNTTYYVAENTTTGEWEIGNGLYISANNALIRTSIINSSNNANIVNFAAGVKNVFVTVPADYLPVKSNGLVQFASTTSAELAGVISDETGTGSLVFANSPVLLGNIGIGTSGAAGTTLRISKDITGATTSYGISSNGIIQSDVTSAAKMFNSFPATQATSFTLNNLYHFQANQGTLGAASAVTTQYGFSATSTLTGATTNYGFHSDIASGTGMYNFYAAGTAMNVFQGSLGIGGDSLAAHSLRISKNIDGATTSYVVGLDGYVQSGVTSAAYGVQSNMGLAAASFTLSELHHFNVTQGSVGGGGSAITSQYGYSVSTGMTGATNNYGFHSNIAAGTGDWNFYAAGTAANYFAGNVGIGSNTQLDSINLRLSTPLTGSTAPIGFLIDAVAQSGATSGAIGQQIQIGTAAAAFTVSNMYQLVIAQGTIGAGSTVTNQYGIIVTSGLTGATNNYGFRADIAVGTGRWNFYGHGTANNHFNGKTTYADKFGYGTTAGVGGTVTQTTNKSTGVTLNKLCGQITANNELLGADTTASFTLTNSTIDSTDIILLNHVSGGTLGKYVLNAAAAAGSATINIRNVSVGSLTEAIVIRYAVIKTVQS